MMLASVVSGNGTALVELLSSLYLHYANSICHATLTINRSAGMETHVCAAVPGQSLTLCLTRESLYWTFRVSTSDDVESY